VSAEIKELLTLFDNFFIAGLEQFHEETIYHQVEK